VRSLSLPFSLIIGLTFVNLVISQEASAHEVPPEFTSELLSTENEQISNNTFKTGEHLTIVGIIANNSHERANISMTLYTESKEGIAHWQVLAKDPPYRTFEIPPGFNDQSYSVTLRALSPGIFHLHLQFNNVDSGESILSAGQTVHVTGPAISPASKVTEINVTQGQSNFTNLRINSTSEITNFSFEEAMKQISFEADPSNVTEGYAIIPVSELLAGPYHVTLNGQLSASYYTLSRQASSGAQTILLSNVDQTLLLIPLSDQFSNKIVINGARIVPEFGSPLTLLAVTAGFVSIYQITRSKVK